MEISTFIALNLIPFLAKLVPITNQVTKKKKNIRIHAGRKLSRRTYIPSIAISILRRYRKREMRENTRTGRILSEATLKWDAPRKHTVRSVSPSSHLSLSLSLCQIHERLNVNAYRFSSTRLLRYLQLRKERKKEKEQSTNCITERERQRHGNRGKILRGFA